MIPAVLGLGSLIAKVAAVAAISRLVKALGASPEKGTPPVTNPTSNLAPQGISSGVQDPKPLSSRGSALPELRSSGKKRLQNGLPAVFGERGERAVVKEYKGNGSTKASYFLGATGRQAIKSDGQWYIYLKDTHGSMTGLVDMAGNRVATYENGDYGDPIVDQGTIYNPYRWNGEPLDAESGLTYMRNRYYQASTGRFIQRDPISSAGGLNLYSYCGGDPINFVDPSGYGVETPWDAVNEGMGVASTAANIAAGNWGGAAVDVLGTGYDVSATAVPGLPAGASTAIKTHRAVTLAQSVRRFYTGSKLAQNMIKAGRSVVQGAERAHHLGAQEPSLLLQLDNCCRNLVLALMTPKMAPRWPTIFTNTYRTRNTAR